MKKINRILAVATLCCFVACAGNKDSKLLTPELFGGAPLAEGLSSPDGMTIGSDGYIYLSMNQAASNWAHPARIMRISPDDVMEEFFVLPVNPKTGVASPLGIVFAADGNIYVSDNQSFATAEPNSAGVLRINLDADGQPLGAELVVDGFNMSNGIARWDECIYVAESNLGLVDGKQMSGVYRFDISELRSGETYTVTGVGDPHLILSFETRNPEHTGGANGVAMDSKGNLYVNNFGDVELYKYTFDDYGNVASHQLLCAPAELLSLDGMQIDSDDVIWEADFLGNAIGKVNSVTGEFTLVAKNSQPIPTTGEHGEFDAPSECIRRGDKVYVSNIDLSYGPQIADPVQTMSVVHLK